MSRWCHLQKSPVAFLILGLPNTFPEEAKTAFPLLPLGEEGTCHVYMCWRLVTYKEKSGNQTQSKRNKWVVLISLTRRHTWSALSPALLISSLSFSLHLVPHSSAIIYWLSASSIPSTMVSAQDKVLHLSLLTCTDRQISRSRLYSHRLLVFRTEVKRCLFTYHSPLSS